MVMCEICEYYVLVIDVKGNLHGSKVGTSLLSSDITRASSTISQPPLDFKLSPVKDRSDGPLLASITPDEPSIFSRTRPWVSQRE